jgi:hypothetical protein
MIGLGPSRYGVFAGLVTTVAGGAHVVAPERFGPMMGLTEPAMTRAIGVADLALVPGLIVSRFQWPGLAGRAVLNPAIIGHLLRLGADAINARLPRTVAAGLAAASVGDLRVVAALQRTDRHPIPERGRT